MIGKLKERKLVAKDTFEMTFDLSGQISFLPGQYVTISIPHPKHEDYQMNQRIFSLVNSPTQNEIVKILFRNRDSGFKKNLREMAMGSEVEVEKPIGMFELPADETIPLVFLATGVGVAPFVSALNFLREQKSIRRIAFFFSNYSTQTTPYFDFLKELSQTMVGFKFIPIMTREPKWPGEKERVSLPKIKRHVPELTQAKFFLAGLPEFVEDLVSQLFTARVSKERIVQESFDGY